jgi:NTE family protein
MFKANILADKELCDLLIEPVDMGNYDTFDVEKGREIYELGYKSASDILQQLSNESQKLLTE